MLDGGEQLIEFYIVTSAHCKIWQYFYNCKRTIIPRIKTILLHLQSSYLHCRHFERPGF